MCCFPGFVKGYFLCVKMWVCCFFCAGIQRHGPDCSLLLYIGQYITAYVCVGTEGKRENLGAHMHRLAANGYRAISQLTAPYEGEGMPIVDSVGGNPQLLISTNQVVGSF